MIKIQKARIEDIKKLIDLGLCLTEHEYACDPLIKKRTKKESQKIYLKALKDSNSVFFTANEGNDTVGYLYGYVFRAPSYYIVRYKRIAQLEAIFVSPRYRKKSVGKLLVDEFFRWLSKKKVQLVQLTAAAMNKDALTFWEKQRFHAHHIEMRKTLKS
jgi:GNAT superfamily N-acetyltransferase